MSFLKKIDELHEKSLCAYGIEKTNNDFSSFINVEPVGISLNNKFIIKKQEKAKLLLVSGKQFVYLPDKQIISTILQMKHMKKFYIDWFLNAFIKFYNDASKTFKFKVEDELFEGIGIDYYPSSLEILLFSDTKIDINDFIFVINFIFSKDKQWEIDASLEDFSKRTIVKYITLIDYYANGSKRSIDFLSEIGFPIDKPELATPLKIKNMFSNVSSFDITKYL